MSINCVLIVFSEICQTIDGYTKTFEVTRTCFWATWGNLIAFA